MNLPQINLENIGLICLAVGAVTIEVKRSWQHGELSIAPRSLWKRLSSWFPTLLLLIGAALYIGQQRSERIGFDPSWPDAIVCSVSEPENLTASKRVPTVFLFRGVAARGKYGTVAMYYFPGWQNHSFPELQNFPSNGYLTHEIWFDFANGALGRPTTDRSGEGFFEALYRLSFPGGDSYPLDCGGETISQVAAKGNAFSFARPFKRD